MNDETQLSNNPLVRSKQIAKLEVQELITKDEARAKRLAEIATEIASGHAALESQEIRAAWIEGERIAEAYALVLNGRDLYGLPPEKYDKRGPLWKAETVDFACARQIHIGNYFKRFAKMKAQDIESATTLLDEANDRFSRSLDRFVNLQKEIADASKKASADIRKATDSLAQGLARLEKVTNFNQLERNVELLERAAKAIELLAALHMAGKLEKIADALH